MTLRLPDPMLLRSGDIVPGERLWVKTKNTGTARLAEEREGVGRTTARREVPDDPSRRSYFPAPPAYTSSVTQTSPWQCYLRWPPGHKWVGVHGSEDSLAHIVRCANCGKEKEHKKLPGGGISSS